MSVFRDADQGQVMPSSRSENEAASVGYRTPHHLHSDIVNTER